MKISKCIGVATLLAFSICGSVRAQNTNIFTVVPAVTTNLVGSTVQLSVLENGLPPVDQLSYQWLQNGSILVDGGNVSGSLTRTLTISSAVVTNAGTYVVMLSVGGVLQATAVAVVYITEINTNIFTVVPLFSTNLVGSTVQLSVLENGLPPVDQLDYQWFKDRTNLVDGGNVSGSQTATLTITSAALTNAGNYVVSLSVSNIVVATPSAAVYVLDLPAVQDVAATTSGAGITFTAQATGGLLAYQWLWQGQQLAGATNSTLVFTNAYANASAGYYSVAVTNFLGAVTSAPPGVLFTKPAQAGTYQGLFFDPTNTALESSGFIQYTLSSSKKSFSGKLMIGANSYSFSGAFSLAHDAQVAVQRPKTNALAMQLQLVTLNNNSQIIGSVSDGIWTASVGGNRLYYSGGTTTSLAGRYTVAFENTNSSPLVPNGAGYGTVQIKKDGSLSLSGFTPDGISFSQGCGLSRLGDWPLYASLLKGRGRLLGWLTVQPQAGSSIQGTNVFHLKGAGADKLYPGGFSILLQPMGSSFVQPTNRPVLMFTNGVSILSGGDLYDTNGVPSFDLVRTYLQPTCKFIPEPGDERLSLGANCGSGLLSGSFVDFHTGKGTPIKAILLQQQNIGLGTFLSTNACGHFSLGGAP
jgi:hypothetical protein